MNTNVLPVFLLGLLFVALALPLIQRRIPPNMWYGFRTAKTLSHPDVWYEANAYSGRTLAWAGAVTCAASLVLGLFPRLSSEHICLWGIGIMLLSVTVSLALSAWYLSKLEAPASSGVGLKELPVEWAPGTMKLLVLPFLLAGLLFTGMSVPLVRGEVPLNQTYGYRTRESMRDNQTWYAVNRYSGQTLLAAGLVLAACAAVLPFVRIVPEKAYVPILLGVMMVSLGVSVYLTERFIDRLPIPGG